MTPTAIRLSPEMDNRAQFDEIGEIRIRMRISNLEARLAMREIEIADLSREIASSLTSSNRREEGIKRRDAEQADWRQIRAELDEMRRSYPRFAHH